MQRNGISRISALDIAPGKLSGVKGKIYIALFAFKKQVIVKRRFHNVQHRHYGVLYRVRTEYAVRRAEKPQYLAVYGLYVLVYLHFHGRCGYLLEVNSGI